MKEHSLKKNDPRELISRAKNGDSLAFGELYTLYFTPVYRYIFARVGRKADAEDIAQIVFVKVFGRVSSFEKRDVDPLAYFFSVAKNSLIDHWRKKKEHSFSDFADESFDIKDEKENGDNQLDTQANLESIKIAMEELTDDQRETIELRFFGERTTKEISEIMGKKEDTIRQLQSRGLRILTNKLKENNGQRKTI